MGKPIMNIADVVPQAMPASFTPRGSAAGLFDVCMGEIATRVGAKKLHIGRAESALDYWDGE
jgi:hypothetical protein